jgi:DNA-binding beta-propeller fold protein YncE
MTLDAQGNLYVLDHHYVVKFSPAGKRLQVWSEYPTTPVSLDPAGITIAASGTVYVADGKNHRVLKLASNGKLQSVWDTSKEPKQTFIASVAVDQQGNFYVIDGPNSRQIEKISPQGSILATWKANCPDDA